MMNKSTDCQSVQVQLDPWQTGELDATSAVAIKDHLSHCPQCRKLSRDLEITRRQVYSGGVDIPREVDQRMLLVIDQIAGEQRSRGSSLVTKFRGRLGCALAGAIIGLLIIQRFDLPLATFLALVGAVLNLCGLLLVSPVLEGSQEWNRA